MTDDVGILINDEARMTNAEGMTKSEAPKPGSANDSFPNEDAEWVIREQPEKNRVYDLQERTARFGEAIIDFAKRIPAGPLTERPLVNWSEQEQALAPITTKQTMQSQKRNF